MVTCRASNNSLLFVLGTELGYTIISPSTFEAEHRLKVFPLEMNLASQPRRQLSRVRQRSGLNNIIHPGCEDHAQVVRRSIILHEMGRNTVIEMGGQIWW